MARRQLGDLIDHLRPDEAKMVLDRLLKKEPRLRATAAALARELFSDSDAEEVAFEIECALKGLDIDDLNDRAGEHDGDYVGPDEAAWDLIMEAVDPFLADLNRRCELGLDGEAVEICKGIVLGLYRAKKNDATSWAPDAPLEIAREAVEALGQLRPQLEGFLARRAPKWAADLGEHRVE